MLKYSMMFYRTQAHALSVKIWVRMDSQYPLFVAKDDLITWPFRMKLRSRVSAGVADGQLIHV